MPCEFYHDKTCVHSSDQTGHKCSKLPAYFIFPDNKNIMWVVNLIKIVNFSSLHYDESGLRLNNGSFLHLFQKIGLTVAV